MKLIPLSQGLFAKVDNADYNWLMQWKWCAAKSNHTFYAERRVWIEGKCERVAMHRLILGLTDPKIYGEHEDRDGLNNQRYNLREATNSQNQKNKRPRGASIYLGVTWHTGKTIYHSKKHGIMEYVYSGWKASINIDGKTRHIGMFKTEIDAAVAYDKMAKLHHKEFANLNFK